ncbi:MAG: ATP-grasp domain-containing protein [Eubacteriaceae bacterium]|nr:ATP-grasp domain-containing protein [Eubacteriaceae bacterium]
MRIQILGGGNNQLSGIIRAKEKGHEVVLTDYYADAPGRVYASFNEVVSTFDVDANIQIAVKYGVDGVMTLGTDQPVYTVACVAAARNLPAFLDVDVARAVTNKEVMKTIFTEKEIPTVPYRFITKEIHEADLAGLKFPVVLKPLDSQGQRGVFKLNTPSEVIKNLTETLSYSRQEKALLEEYYESDEITVSAWVETGVACILTVTDREIFQFGKHIGICFAHDFPSKHLGAYETIKGIIDRITSAFGIKNGPLYVQLLVGKTGILVNEVACRIGGAYEDIFIPYLTGIDLLDRVIDFSLGLKPSSSVAGYNLLYNKKHLSVQLFFARPGKVMDLTAVEELTELPGVISAGYNIAKGMVLKAIDNATARAGYMVVTGETRDALNNNVDHAFRHLKIIDENGENLVIQPKKYS